MCPFGNDEGIPEGSKGTRYCGLEGWMMYDGDACLPVATYRLIQLAMVCIVFVGILDVKLLYTFVLSDHLQYFSRKHFTVLFTSFYKRTCPFPCYLKGT